MTPAERELARDIAVLDFLTPDQLLQETGLAERWAAEGRETPEDRAYRAELERRARSV